MAATVLAEQGLSIKTLSEAVRNEMARRGQADEEYFRDHEDLRTLRPPRATKPPVRGGLSPFVLSMVPFLARLAA